MAVQIPVSSARAVREEACLHRGLESSFRPITVDSRHHPRPTIRRIIPKLNEQTPIVRIFIECV